MVQIDGREIGGPRTTPAGLGDVSGRILASLVRRGNRGRTFALLGFLCLAASFSFSAPFRGSEVGTAPRDSAELGASPLGSSDVVVPSRDSSEGGASYLGSNATLIKDSQGPISKGNVGGTSCLPDHVHMETALSCLRLTNASLDLQYPEDAQAHFDEIHNYLRPWAMQSRMHGYAGYRGPWVENIWISHFENRTNSTTSCLSDAFGPFIPIFFPWVDFWLKSNPRRRYPERMLDGLKMLLRHDVPYATVSQNDAGIAPCQILIEAFPNIMVMSAGGYGHVPVPLLKQEEGLNNGIPMNKKTRLVSYVGSLSNAPRGMRKLMHRTLERRLRDKYTHYYGEAWRSIMADSRVSLAPRGYGRTAFHLSETLQMGLIPIHVYTDIPWVPYANVMRDISFSTTVNNLTALVKQLQTMTDRDLQRMEEDIVSFRDSHFTATGTMHQIELFLKGGGGDLICQKIPGSVRDAPLTKDLCK